MSAISALTTNNPPSTGSATGGGFNSLTSEDFVRIMTSELSNQDPLAPNDSKAILEQISSIRSIESNLSLEKTLKSLVSQNEFASAGGLLGKQILGLDDQGNPVHGKVRSVASTKEGAVLNLDAGVGVKMKNLVQILGDEAAAAANALLPPAPTGGGPAV